MRLYVYDHCPYCLKVRVVLAAKKLNCELVTFLNNDERAPISMIGKKIVPILEYGLGMLMPESLDIIEFVDKSFGKDRQFTDQTRYSQSEQIYEILSKMQPIIKYLAYPRQVKVPVHEFMTQAAIDYFTAKKQQTIGNFELALRQTASYIENIEPLLVQLDEIISSINPTLSLENINMDDVEIFSRLRSLYLVELLSIPIELDRYLRKMSQLTKIALFSEAAC